MLTYILRQLHAYMLPDRTRPPHLHAGLTRGHRLRGAAIPHPGAARPWTCLSPPHAADSTVGIQMRGVGVRGWVPRPQVPPLAAPRPHTSLPPSHGAGRQQAASAHPPAQLLLVPQLRALPSPLLLLLRRRRRLLLLPRRAARHPAAARAPPAATRTNPPAAAATAPTAAAPRTPPPNGRRQPRQSMRAQTGGGARMRAGRATGSANGSAN